MHYAALILRFRKCGSNGFFNAGKPIGADDKNVLYTAVFKLIEDLQPVFWAFIFTNGNRQHLFDTILIYAKYYIGCKLAYYAVVTDGIVYGINVNDGIYIV